MRKFSPFAIVLLRTVFPLFGIFAIELFFSQWITLLAIALAFLYSYTCDTYEKREWILAVVGVILGFVIEVGLGLVARQQYWSETFLFSVPVWLPFIWGYAFIIIRRVGNRVLV